MNLMKNVVVQRLTTKDGTNGEIFGKNSENYFLVKWSFDSYLTFFRNSLKLFSMKF